MAPLTIVSKHAEMIRPFASIFLQKIFSIRLGFKDKGGLFRVTFLFLRWVLTKSGKVTLMITLITKIRINKY